MTPGVMIEQAADEIVSVAETLSGIADGLRSAALLVNLDTEPGKLRHTALAVQADALRVAMAALQAARASERVVATLVVTTSGEGVPNG